MDIDALIESRRKNIEVMSKAAQLTRRASKPSYTANYLIFICAKPFAFDDIRSGSS